MNEISRTPIYTVVENPGHNDERVVRYSTSYATIALWKDQNYTDEERASLRPTIAFEKGGVRTLEVE